MLKLSKASPIDQGWEEALKSFLHRIARALTPQTLIKKKKLSAEQLFSTKMSDVFRLKYVRNRIYLDKQYGIIVRILPRLGRPRFNSPLVIKLSGDLGPITLS